MSKHKSKYKYDDTYPEVIPSQEPCTEEDLELLKIEKEKNKIQIRTLLIEEYVKCSSPTDTQPVKIKRKLTSPCSIMMERSASAPASFLSSS